MRSKDTLTLPAGRDLAHSKGIELRSNSPKACIRTAQRHVSGVLATLDFDEVFPVGLERRGGRSAPDSKYSTRRESLSTH